MLDVNNVLPTLYNDRKMKICRSDGSDRKEQKKIKKRFQNKCVSSQNKQYEKRRGRHGRLSAILSPTFPQ
jgi:hypothetical protein